MKQRDLELLSSYLDGQLTPSDSARLEARLRTDQSLRSVLDDLRSARSLLRQLPMRKAPRNFRLTPRMVGKNPPLPRAYPVFRFSSVLATLLLFITFGLNLLGPQLASAPPMGFGGMGGGGAAESDTFAVQEAPAAATEAPAASGPAEEPSVAMAPMTTQTADAAADSARILDTPSTENTEDPFAAKSAEPEVSSATPAPLVSSVLQWLLAGVAVVSAFIMAMMRQLSINRWRKK